MSYLREQDDLRDPRENGMGAPKEHELTLSTTAIFGIFFGQVVLCAIFFGFGYSLGGHRSTGALPSGDAATASNSSANFGSFKPAAGTTAGTVAARPAVVASPAVADAPEETPAPKPAALAAGESKPAPVVRSAPVAVEAPKPVAPAAVPATGFLVQVAAISINHPDDATMLQNALRAKGYSVSAHPGPDQFIHLLLGPFNERSAAEAMRQRLLTDGYTAYIK